MFTGPIDLDTPLGWRSAFAFPLQTRESRREVFIGAALLLLPVVGWLLNMGHRVQMVHNMQNGMCPWPAWRHYGRLLKYGTVTFLGMVEYALPAMAVGVLAWRRGSWALALVAIGLWLLATVAVPGYMSHYCLRFDAREVFNPVKALRRVAQGGRAYWHAWLIALAALSVSFLGLLGFGVGFLRPHAAAGATACRREARSLTAPRLKRCRQAAAEVIRTIRYLVRKAAAVRAD